jgi:predicted nucleotidyltransferase component of viral defense system
MAKDIFYSPNEKIVFYVAGYTDNSYKVDECIKVLKEGQLFLEKLISKFQSIDTREVKSAYITKSRRYKSMRVFWIEGVNQAPRGAFVINSDGGDYWNMWKWLEN